MRSAILILVLSASTAWANCPPPGGIRGGALTGTWKVDAGSAQVGGNPMMGGTNRVVLQSTGNGLSADIGSFSFSMKRLPEGEPEWVWDKAEGVSVDNAEFNIVMGCPNNQMTRYQGEMAVEGQIVTWRLMAASEDFATLYWSFPGPPAAQGLFAISK